MTALRLLAYAIIAAWLGYGAWIFVDYILLTVRIGP
jgi:hypothetical protein